MYPGTIFNWHDNSQIVDPVTTSAEDTAPLFLQVFSADKGTEDLIEISGSDFNAMYGTMSFAKHGQSAIQAQNIINAGGKLYAKRIVAEDSTLANVILIANVSNPSETEAAQGKTVKVTWESKSITDCKTFAEVKNAASGLFTPATFDQETGKLLSDGVYPVFVYSDNGRGVSKKAVRLNPDYSTSKSIGKTFYTLAVYEGTTISEQVTITVDPTVIHTGTAYRLNEFTNTQITGLVLEDVYEAYAEVLANLLVLDIDVAKSYDLVYGYTNKGAVLDKFILEGVDLDADNGVALTEGSNGAFGDAPAGKTEWETALINVFNGTFSDEIYDVDQHKIAAIFDANYPMTVKEAIYDLVAFRQDMVYFRDYGLGLNTFAAINEVHASLADKCNYFTADYATSYMIIDPSSRKNVEVTMTYDLAAVAVNHFENNAFAPVAGIINGMVLPSAIKGTINFVPVITPAANQKEAMDNIRVNYAIFEDNNCVVQSCYTSQDAYTQLSFVSNVIGIQTVLRAVRTACPRQRYALSTGTDLQAYATAVNNVLSEFNSNFAQLNFIYQQDDLKASQKIFYASIEFAFLNWAQTEIFDIYVING
jgi:hypothetical protein